MQGNRAWGDSRRLRSRTGEHPIPDETLTGILNQVELTSDMTEDEVLAAALKVDSQLISLYEELAGESSVPHVRELFEALARMQEARERQLARAVQ